MLASQRNREGEAMDVTGISVATSQQAADAGVLQARRAQMLGPVATLFKESTDQLESELKTTGVSLGTRRSRTPSSPTWPPAS
jgi:hypothetical protein